MPGVKVEAIQYGDRKVYSVAAFNRGVADWLTRLPSVWVEGEITELRRHARWQSVFFTLKDPSDGACLGVTILLCGVDTFFRGKLEVLLAGHHLVTTDSADWPDLVIADIARVDPEEVADAFPDVPILGFGGHTDTSGLRRAHAAGFDQVVVKNALQERAAQLVEELTASVE